jgi:hypothetical protein
MSTPNEQLREWALRHGSRPGGWPLMPDPLVECLECGADFTPDDPDAVHCPRCDDSRDGDRTEI